MRTTGPYSNGKTVLSGSGAPSGSTGTNGDFYIDLTNWNIYGPKTAGAWPSGVALQGNSGSPGAAATVSVGSTTTGAAGSSASVSNSGSSSAAVLNFTIPRGDVGATGSAGVNAFGSPTSRTLSLATAYQATNTAKPAVVTINLTSTANFSLAGGTTNTADIVIGSTNAVASGTGSVMGKYANSITGTIAVGLNMNSTMTNTYTINLPTGWFFAIRQTGGTVSIQSAFDQTVG